MICTLGTTLAVAGSREAFRRVDHDYPLAAARICRLHGATTYALTSAHGASSTSRFFYNRVKGDLERDLNTLGFRSLVYVRPGLIGGARDHTRKGEHLAGIVLSTLAPILPRSLRICPAARIAQSLIDAALRAEPGVHTVTSANLAD